MIINIQSTYSNNMITTYGKLTCAACEMNNTIMSIIDDTMYHIREALNITYVEYILNTTNTI